MGWLRLVGSIKLQVSFAKEPYKTDNFLHKRPVILSILLTIAIPYQQLRALEETVYLILSCAHMIEQHTLQHTH